jgi:hypothetical protein
MDSNPAEYFESPTFGFRIGEYYDKYFKVSASKYQDRIPNYDTATSFHIPCNELFISYSNATGRSLNKPKTSKQYNALKRGYRFTHLNEQKFPVNARVHQCLLRFWRCSCDLYSGCSICFPCVSTQCSADRAGQLTGPPRPLHCPPSLVQVLSDSAQKLMWCPIMHEQHLLSLMKRHKFQKHW